MGARGVHPITIDEIALMLRTLRMSAMIEQGWIPILDVGGGCRVRHRENGQVEVGIDLEAY